MPFLGKSSKKTSATKLVPKDILCSMFFMTKILSISAIYKFPSWRATPFGKFKPSNSRIDLELLSFFTA